VASADIEVHPEQVAAHGARIRAAAQESHAQTASLQQELAGYGQPWGNDMVGSLIGACYGAISALAMASFKSNAEALDAQGARVQAMAAAWQQAEDTNTANVHDVSLAEE
jgi:surfactin synthase thioesterase subunit